MTTISLFQKNMVFFCALVFLGLPVFGQELTLAPEDFRIEVVPGEGFHMFIRKKPDIGSVLLTESTVHPDGASDNYALRASEWNSFNGDETRLLDGVPLSGNVYSLIDSTPETHPDLGPAFRVYVPWVVRYGYENGRNGEIQITDGTFINIRAFSLPYGDYRGRFADNPFTFQVVQRPHEGYLPEAETAFSEIARLGGGTFEYAKTPSELVAMIGEILEKEAGRSVDIVLCLDTTGSMEPYIDELRKALITMLEDIISDFSDCRIGMVLFKDYYQEYLNSVVPFTRDFALFQRQLNAIRVRGGGDIPEAVYEALYEGADKFSWEAESRLLILAGDAPPHARDKGKISEKMVEQMVAGKGIKLSSILLSSSSR